MKKTIAWIFTLMLCFGMLTACGGSKAPAAASANPPAETSPAENSPAESGPVEAAPAEREDQSSETDTAAEESQELVFGGDKFVGEWSDTDSQRATLTVIPTDFFGVYSVTLHWGDTAASFVEWDMTASYDETSDSIQYTDGSRSYVTLHEDAPEESVLEWKDSEGRFFLEGELLRWEDNKEESDEDVRFVKVTTYAPTAADLAESFFKPVAEIPNGTSGAMLHKAQVAYDTLRFASGRVIWCNDPDALRANLKEAWAGLTAEEKAAVDENIFSIHGLIVDSAVNWTDYGYLFEDAGISEEMQSLEADRTALESFYRLFDNTVAVCLGEGQ